MDLSKLKKYIIAIDIGTTKLKCYLYSNRLNVVHRIEETLNVIYSCDGAAEIIPADLWNSVVNNVGKLLSEANISSSEVSCLALCSQRATFTLWDRHTDHLLLNLITWKDRRAAEESSKWNNSFVLRVLRFIFYCIYMISGSQRFLVASKLKFSSAHVTMRLLWALKNNRELRTAVENGTAVFGTLDTWLIYRLTNGKSYCTDYSAASATGMYDPFILSWTFLLKLFGIPYGILPPVGDCVGTHFGNVSADIWGSEIPILCSMADQSASAYSLSCVDRGDVKLALGTGGFMSNTVGQKVFSHKNDIICPLIYWKYRDIQTCVLEGAFYNCGTMIDWAHRAGYFSKLEELSELAESVPDSDGIYFRSEFLNSHSNTQLGDNSLNEAFVGATGATKKVFFVRAILESIVFQVYHLHTLFRKEAFFNKRSPIRINGGVSNNDFVCQSIADICQVVVSRPPCVEASIRGVALLAGCSTGIFDLDDIDDCDDRIFHPNDRSGQMLRSKFSKWLELNVDSHALCFL